LQQDIHLLGVAERPHNCERQRPHIHTAERLRTKRWRHGAGSMGTSPDIQPIIIQC
jgi:hypothetical protein